MSSYPLLYGSILTLGIIMPLGAQNIYIFNQGLTQLRFRDSLPSVISATICDSLLIFLAIWGISLFIFKIFWLKLFMLFSGGCFLIYLSYSLWFTKSTTHAEAASKSYIKQILYSFSVSILNPQALLDTFLIVGSSALLFSSLKDKLYLASGCIITELIWFSFLSFAGNQMRRLPNLKLIMAILNRIAALIIIFISISMFIQIFIIGAADI